MTAYKSVSDLRRTGNTWTSSLEDVRKMRGQALSCLF